MIDHNRISTPDFNANRNRFLLLDAPLVAGDRAPGLAAKGLAFFHCIDRKYRFQRTGENFPLYFLHLRPDPVPVTIEHAFHFKPRFHWTLVNVNRAAAPSALSISPLIAPSLLKALTPSLTRSLTRLLTRSFSRPTSFTFITHLHQGKREIISITERERSIEITAAEGSRASIFTYFSTLNKFLRQPGAVSINRLITQSLTQSLTPSLTRSLTTQLTRSLHLATASITHFHEDKREIKDKKLSEKVRESETRYWETTSDTYLIHQRADAAAERIRADISNYFSTLNKFARLSAPESINRLITQSLTQTLTPSLTLIRSLTTQLTRSLNLATAFITHFHEDKREIKSETIREREREREGRLVIAPAAAIEIHQRPDTAAERIRADIFTYFSTLDRFIAQSEPVSINRLITQSLTLVRTLTPSLTLIRSLTTQLTRSLNLPTAFITHFHEEKKEIKRSRIERRGSAELDVRPAEIRGRETTHDTYLIHQRTDAAAERIRADIFHYFSTLDRFISQSAPASINRLIAQSLTQSLTPSLTQSLTTRLTHSLNLTTPVITHFHKDKREIKGKRVSERVRERIRESETRYRETTTDTYLIHQRPDAAAESSRAEIFHYFSTLDRFISRSAPVSINRLIAQSLTRSLSPSLTRSLTTLLTRSLKLSTSFITHDQEEKKEIKSPGVPGGHKIRPYEPSTIERRASADLRVLPAEVRDRETTHDTYLIHQHPDAAAEHIRTDISNYFSTLNKFIAQSGPASINRLIAQSLTRSLTPSLTQSLTTRLTHALILTTPVITRFHEDKREIKGVRVSERVSARVGERIRESETRYRERTTDTYLIHQRPETTAERSRADIFHYFSTLDKFASQSAPASINRLIAQSLTRSLTPSLTQSLTTRLTHALILTTPVITRFHENKREIKGVRVSERISERVSARVGERIRESETRYRERTTDTYLIHQRPETTAERSRADIFHYFSTLDKFASQSAPASINRLIAQSLTRSLTPSLTKSLTTRLTHALNLTTPVITRFHENKREIKGERVSERVRERIRESETRYRERTTDTYLIHQRPETTAERSRAGIFHYFSTLDRFISQSAPASINRLIIQSLTRSLTQSLSTRLTPSLKLSTPLITHFQEDKREIKGKKVRERETRYRERTTDTYLIHQRPDAAVEGTRADIFSYFSNLSKFTSQSAAASINRLITTSLAPSSAPSLPSALTSSLTSSLTRSFTRLLTPSFNSSTSFITHLHEGDIENRFPIFSKVTAPASTTSLTQSFQHTNAFVSYLLHKGKGERERGMEFGAAAGNDTPNKKLEMEKPVKNKAPLPDLPVFKKERLEMRHTSAFILAGTWDTQVPGSRIKIKDAPIILPAKQWLSSKTAVVDGKEPSPIESFLQKGRESPTTGSLTAPRSIDLSTLATENDSSRSPLIEHAPQADKGLSEERIKKIEQTIATQSKQIETRLKDAVSKSASSFASGVSSAVPQDMNLPGLTDQVFHMLMERVKRERRMMGY